MEPAPDKVTRNRYLQPGSGVMSCGACLASDEVARCDRSGVAADFDEEIGAGIVMRVAATRKLRPAKSTPVKSNRSRSGDTAVVDRAWAV
jgi:hypothetical protein